MDEILDQHDVAKYLKVTTRTLRTWIQHGEILAPVRVGRRQYWLRAELESWLRERFRAGAQSQRRRGATKSGVRRGRPRQPV